MRFRDIKTIFWIFLLFTCSFGWAQVRQFSGRSVGGIEILLQEEAPSSSSERDLQAIRSRLKTQVGESFSQLDFDEDLKILSEDYGRVEPSIAVKEGEVFITIKLWPKPIIQNIAIEGNEHVSRSKLLRELEIHEGDLFDRTAFAQAFQKLRTHYTKKGFFEAELSYQILPLPDQNGVDILIQINEGRTGRVRQISFEGFTSEEESDLLEAIQTKRYSFLTSWMNQAGTFQQECAEQDRFVVLDYLQNHGYAAATVELSVEELPRRNGLLLRFTAHKGEKFSFGDVELDGNELFTQEEILSAIDVKSGETFSPAALRESVSKISNLYGSKGYIEALINYDLKLRPDAPIYDVSFDIEEGEPFRVGLVRIFGNRRTQQRVILHESQLVPGRVFDIRRLQQTEETLRNIGYFENVNVYAVRSPAEQELGPTYRDVHIEVEEAGTGSFGIFGGFSTLDNASIGVELVEKNFNYAGLSQIFTDGLGALRGGGEFLRLRANLGAWERSYLASWTKPFFMDTRWIVGGDLERSISQLQSRDYETRNYGLSVRATYPFNVFFRMGWHYRLRHSNVRIRNPASASEDLRLQAKNNGTVSGFGLTMVYDSTDWRHTRGFHSILEAELIGFFGEYRFFSLAYLNAYYRPMPSLEATLKLRYEFRVITPLPGQLSDEIPISERLFMGGETTVRGYKPFNIGPKFPGQPNEPRGGLTSMLWSAELMRTLAPIIDVSVFVDAGYVDLKSWRFRTPRASIGACALLKVGNVPLIIGYGYPLNAANRNDRQPFFFSVGGRF